jgi:hypothetical protein
MSDTNESTNNEIRRTVVVPSRGTRTSNIQQRVYTREQRRDLRNIKSIIRTITSITTHQSTVNETQLEEGEIQDVNTTCCVCFNVLENNNKHIETPCNHHYCNDCFFRWIRINTTCAVCRRSFSTGANLSEEEIQRESNDVYQEYSRILYPYLETIKNLYKAHNKYITIELQRKTMLNTQIALQNLTTYSKGYLIGYYDFTEKDLNCPLSELKNYIKNNIGDMDAHLDTYKQGYELGTLNAIDDLKLNGEDIQNLLMVKEKSEFNQEFK